jgi:sec-independent protein translocase protein TatA
MNVMFAAFGLGGWEVVLILAAILLLFGAKKLPELARGLGSGIKEFKKATKEVTDEVQNAANETSVPPTKLPQHVQPQSTTVVTSPPVSQSSNPPPV